MRRKADVDGTQIAIIRVITSCLFGQLVVGEVPANGGCKSFISEKINSNFTSFLVADLLLFSYRFNCLESLCVYFGKQRNNLLDFVDYCFLSLHIEAEKT
jgi:hypothetical protein